MIISLVSPGVQICCDQLVANRAKWVAVLEEETRKKEEINKNKRPELSGEQTNK